jgi:predicted nucleotide-binding protein
VWVSGVSRRRWFFGSLGRERVAILYEPDVEKPSDIDGLVYIELDPDGVWKGPS